MPREKRVNPNAFLDTLDPPEPGSDLAGARSLPLALVDSNPAQSRQIFDVTALAELATSIATQGVIQPIVVRAVGDRYQIVAGERRTRAAKIAGLREIPAIIRDLTDTEAAYVTAVENLQREDLDIEDEARWLHYLYEQTPDATYRKIGDMIGKSHVYVVRRLQLLAHPDLMQQIRSGALTQRAALQQIDPPPPPPAAESLVHGVPNPPTIVERAELDARPAPGVSPRPPAYLGADPTSPPLQRTPWRDRPLQGFMDWVARVDVTTVPLEERAAKREQIVELREWLTRLELQLLPPESDEAI